MTGPLSPGRYGTLAFEPAIAFELGEGWSALFADDSDEVALLHDSDVFLAFTRVSQVVDPSSGTAVPAPDDLIAWFVDHPQAAASAPVPVSVAGLDGRAVDVTPSEEVGIFAYPTGNMRMPPGRTHRFSVLPMEGPDLVIVTGSPSAGFDAALALTEPILDSLEVQQPG